MSELSIRQRCSAIRESLDLAAVATGWYGHELDKQGRGVCPFCGGSNKTKFRVVDKKGFKCAGCEEHGDVIKYIQKQEGLTSINDAVAFIEEKLGTDLPDRENGAPAGRQAARQAKLEEQARYDYHSADGEVAYTIVRYWNPDRERKECKPWRNGKMGLSAEHRILYNLNSVANVMDQTIYLVEGEKCADAMMSLGYVSTCNPFGCGEWKEEFGYAKYLEGRKVVIMPDADESGAKWLKSIIDDLRGTVGEIRVIELPKTWVKKHKEFVGHDIADYLQVEGEDETKSFIEKAERKAERMMRGFEGEISITPNTAYEKYITLMDAGNFNVLDFSMWLPSMQVKARRGDLVCFLAGTKTGKSRILMNLMYHMNNVNYLLFDLELSAETVGERWCALHHKVSVDHVQAAHKLGHPYTMPDLSHIHIVPCGAKDMRFVKERIDAVEQVTGKSMDCVGIDYVGLMRGDGGKGKTQELSGIVEEFKGEMNNLKKVGFITSQRRRPDDVNKIYQCPSLFENKDASAIENSAQLSFGVWKLREQNMLGFQVLAYSHGNCNEEPIALRTRDLYIEEILKEEL